MNSITRWAFDPTRNALVALLRGAGGTKSLPMALATIPFVGTNPEVGGATPFQLTKDHARVQVLNPAGAITVKLPTTGIAAGEVVRIANRSAFDVTVQSSDATAFTVANGANIDATVQSGYVQFVALQNAPTTPAHWLVTDVYSESSFTATATGFTANPTGTVKTVKRNKTVTIYFPAIQATSNATTMTITGMPVEIRPSIEQRMWGHTVDAGASQLSRFVLDTGGTFTVTKFNSAADAAGAFTNSLTKGTTISVMHYSLA